MFWMRVWQCGMAFEAGNYGRCVFDGGVIAETAVVVLRCEFHMELGRHG